MVSNGVLMCFCWCYGILMVPDGFKVCLVASFKNSSAS